ncbi:ABC transporter substrate-binding protein [Chitinibacter sp. SCUT-21]|uniref:substrate-binding periplasmic protein n=1 Tax=Chitinibacter sp. SCUT-21 TaxID=2970891 RepID=UPI0035A6E9C5
MRVLPLLMLFGCASSLISAETLKAYTEEFAPFNYTQQGQYLGLANQILDRISQSSGLQFERESLPWLRASNENQAHPNSLLYTTVRTPQREKQYLWVGPYDDCDVVFIKLKNRSDIQINSLKDAEKYTAGAARGAAASQILASMGYNMARLDTRSPEEARTVRMLYAKRFDLSAGMLIPHVYSAKQQRYDASQLTAAYTITKTGGCFFAFNPQVNPNLYQRFNTAFEQLRSSGELDKIRRQYLGNDIKSSNKAKP